MAYPPSSTYPAQQQPQYQQSLHNNYQSDQYLQPAVTHQVQETFSQQDPFPLDSFNQQGVYQQDSYSQFQQFPNQPDSYSQQSPFSQPDSFPQPNQLLQQPQSAQQYPQQIQQPHAQFPQQAQYLQQSHQPPQFGQAATNQYAQSPSPNHQNSFLQQTQPSLYSQPTQAQPDRFGQRNSPVHSNQYTQHNRAIQPDLHSQQTSPVQPNQFSPQGTQTQPNIFSQRSQHQFSQVPQAHLNQQTQQQFTQNRPTHSAQQTRRSPFPQHQDNLVQRSQSLPQYPQQQHLAQQQISRVQSRQSSGDVTGTYQLFFTGRDDPRGCMLIGEDTKPVYLTFETQESNLNQPVQTLVYRNNRDLCAQLEWGTGAYLGNVTIGTRKFPMSHLVLPGSTDNARRFTSHGGELFEWRRIREDTTSYDLYMAPNVRIALFRKFNQSTTVGPSHGLIQYTFSNDVLLLEVLLSLLLNRWIDMNGIQFSG